MSFTERARFNFKVRRSGGDRPFIYLEPMKNSLSFLNPEQSYLGSAPNYRLLCFDLAENVSWEEAERMVELLNENISTIGFTHLIDVAH